MRKDINFSTYFDHAITAVRSRSMYTCTGRTWWFALQRKYKLHPVVRNIVYDEGIRPIDWHLLLLEWPHVAESDESRLAYTRNERAGEDNKQTLTSIGKYLSRHWPHVRDDVRRDWAGRFAPGTYELWGTKEGIISGVERGPQSCMKSSSGSIPFYSVDHTALMAYHSGCGSAADVRWDRHPYAAYAPEYGWRMAVHLDGQRPPRVVGRALVNVNALCTLRGAKGMFVRSYKRNEDDAGGISYTDERLEDWLQQQGYASMPAWPDGLKLARLDHPSADGFMAPYIDGANDRVDDYGDCLVLSGDGTYECSNTDGTADGDEEEDEEDEVYGECEDCGNTVYEHDEDRIWAGRTEGRLVCSCCAEGYTYATGTDVRGRDARYWVKDDDTVRVDGTAYDLEHMPDRIVHCLDDEHRHIDNCVCDVDGDYHEEGSDAIALCEDGEHRKREDCWQDAHSKEWYPDDAPQITLGGETYHPNTLRALADNT